MANEFQYRGQLNGADQPVVLPMLIANSQTVVVGRAVKLQTRASGGGVLPATAGSTVAGIVIGLVDQFGIDLQNTKQSLAGTISLTNQSYLAASNNMTVDKVRALVVTDPMALWWNISATAVLAVADLYKYFDLTTASQIASQTGSDTAGSFQLMKLDPDGDGVTTKGIFKITESIYYDYTQP